MSKNKLGFRKLFSKSEEDCCSVEIEEVKKETEFTDMSNESDPKKA